MRQATKGLASVGLALAVQVKSPLLCATAARLRAAAALSLGSNHGDLRQGRRE